MSELKQRTPSAVTGNRMHEHPVDFKSYLRRCIYVFIAVLCATSLMIWSSYLPASTAGR